MRVYRTLMQLLPTQIKTEIDPVRIVEDMYSLNIVGLPNFEREAREIVEEFLPRYITNPQVTKLLGASREDLFILCEQLITMRPYIANMAHEILKNSNEGIQLQLIGSFSNVQTINRLINEDQSRDVTIFTLGKGKDNDAIVLIKKRLENSELPIPLNHPLHQVVVSIKCTYQAACFLRRQTWGFDIEGITSPIPNEQIYITDYDNLPDSLKDDCIIVKTSYQLKMAGKGALGKRGPYHPYLGSATLEKITKAVVIYNMELKPPEEERLQPTCYLEGHLNSPIVNDHGARSS